VIEMMMAGASAVEIGSALRGNPGMFREISTDLYREAGISPNEIVGCAHE